MFHNMQNDVHESFRQQQIILADLQNTIENVVNLSSVANFGANVFVSTY